MIVISARGFSIWYVYSVLIVLSACLLLVYAHLEKRLYSRKGLPWMTLWNRTAGCFDLNVSGTHAL